MTQDGFWLPAKMNLPRLFTRFNPNLLALEMGLEIGRDISKTFYGRLRNIFHPYFLSLIQEMNERRA